MVPPFSGFSGFSEGNGYTRAGKPCTICGAVFPSCIASISESSSPYIGAIAELERKLIIERVRSGMRRARLEGRHIGRFPLELNRDAIRRDRPQTACRSRFKRGPADGLLTSMESRAESHDPTISKAMG